MGDTIKKLNAGKCVKLPPKMGVFLGAFRFYVPTNIFLFKVSTFYLFIVGSPMSLIKTKKLFYEKYYYLKKIRL